MTRLRGDWQALTTGAVERGAEALELAALSESELPGLLDYVEADRLPAVEVLTAHAPIKGRHLSERRLLKLLGAAPPTVVSLIFHPDQVREVRAYRELGSRTVIENMDTRKTFGRTRDELASLFASLPEAGFCLDLAHARAVDPTMVEAEKMLETFGDRLRQIHLSSLDQRGRHAPLTSADRRLFWPILERCRSVPWILEAVA